MPQRPTEAPKGHHSGVDAWSHEPAQPALRTAVSPCVVMAGSLLSMPGRLCNLAFMLHLATYHAIEQVQVSTECTAHVIAIQTHLHGRGQGRKRSCHFNSRLP